MHTCRSGIFQDLYSSYLLIEYHIERACSSVFPRKFLTRSSMYAVWGVLPILIILLELLEGLLESRGGLLRKKASSAFQVVEPISGLELTLVPIVSGLTPKHRFNRFQEIGLLRQRTESLRLIRIGILHLAWQSMSGLDLPN